MADPLRLALLSPQPHDELYLRPALKAAGHTSILVDTHASGREATALQGCQGVISFVGDALDATRLEALSQLGIRFVAQRAAGVDNIDLDAAKRLGVRVTHVPAYSPESVAEHALALLLAIARNLPQALAQVQHGDFRLDGLLGFSLHGKTVGIVGMGGIGQACARILRGFGCRVIATSRSGFEIEGVEAVSSEVLWRESQIVSLHCPLTSETRHLVGPACLSMARPGLILINTARGGIVDTEAVLDALESGQLGAYGADVYENEACVFFRDCSRCGYDDPVLKRLLAHSRTLITPHQAFFTHESLREIALSVTASVDAFSRGEQTADFLV
ncbi:MAG: 2-hydroxyacid dehydrogenase [Thiobacillus sp.]|nr:2-hydroxyacid dehydrogenase [Thiobacillus sp.]